MIATFGSTCGNLLLCSSTNLSIFPSNAGSWEPWMVLLSCRVLCEDPQTCCPIGWNHQLLVYSYRRWETNHILQLILPSGKLTYIDPEDHIFLEETNLPTSIYQGPTVNLLEGNWIGLDSVYRRIG